MASQSTHPFTCNTCQVAFKSSDLQRTHMQTDWHRYNLKRRVASLPPLSSEVFAEKVLASKADAAATAARALFERACDACQKTYYSENAYNNHIQSKKHKLNAEQLSISQKRKEEDPGSLMSSTFSLGDAKGQADDSDDEGDDEVKEELKKVLDGIQKTKLDDEADPISRRPTRPHHSDDNLLSPQSTTTSTASKAATGDISREDALKQCLFCTNYATDLDENMQHMKKIHSLFIPEQKYLADLEGLIAYLSSKVYDDYQCLYCNRLKWSEEGITTHMRDTRHCKIAYETEEQQLEIGQYYDFRSTYSDDGSNEDEDEEMEDGQVIRDEDEGWETSSTASSVPTDELGAVYEDADKAAIKTKLRQNRHHAHGSAARHKSADGFHSHAHVGINAVYHDEFELHLPTGRVAGHRSLHKYYKQNLRNYPTPAERAERADRLLTQGEDSDEEMLDDDADARGRGRRRDQQLTSRANGGTGMLAVSDQKKREVQVKEKQSQKSEARHFNKVQWRDNKQNNHQKHWRDHLLQ